MEEINDVVQRGSVLIYSASFDGVVDEASRRYLVTKKQLSRNKRLYNLALYEMGLAHQVVHGYDTSTLFQHRSQYYIIP
jgi:hypothetical protein